MAITPAALADLPHLRLTLVAGREGAGAEISWAHSSDHPRPEQWLTGRELVLRNAFSLPAAPADQADLVRRLAQVGVAGLVIGLDPDLPELGDALLAAADRHDLALLTTPYSSGFVTIERAVGELVLQAGETGRLASIERIYRAVAGALTRGADAEAVQSLARSMSCRLAVVDALDLTPVFAPAARLPRRIHAQLQEQVAHYRGTIPGVLHLPDPQDRAWVIEVPGDEPTLLVVHAVTGPAPDLPVLQHLATAIGVLLTEHARELEHTRRVGAELFSSIVAHQTSEATALRELRARRLDPVGVAVYAIDRSRRADGMPLHLAFERRQLPHLMLDRSDALLVLAPAATDLVLPVLRARLGDGTALGISAPLTETTRAADAVREAVWAMRVAQDIPDRTASYVDAPLLTGIRGPGEARALIDRVLGPVLTQDAERGSDLVLTLRTYLQLNRSWQATAEELSVHRQTVVYRIDQVRRLSGLDLRQTGDLALCWLALRALDDLDDLAAP